MALAFMQKFETIRSFFLTLKEQSEQMTDDSALINIIADSREESYHDRMSSKLSQMPKSSESIKRIETEETATQRQVERPKRSTYITKKPKLPAPPPAAAQTVRPSDIFAFEQNKKTIDQLCSDNQVLHENLQDAMRVIDKLKNHIQSSQTDKSLQTEITKLKELLKIKEVIYKAIIVQKEQVQHNYRNKWTQMVEEIQGYLIEVEDDFAEYEKFIAQILTENQFLRKLLGLTFSQEQLAAVTESQAEAEFNFFDNFCISRRDLENQAIMEYEKQLIERKGKIEKQFVDWHVSYMNEQQQPKQMQQPLIAQLAQQPDFQFEDTAPKKKQITKEEKERIMADLLRPIGNKKVVEPEKQEKQFFESKAMMHGDMGLDNEFMRQNQKMSLQIELLSKEKEPLQLDNQDDDDHVEIGDGLEGLDADADGFEDLSPPPPVPKQEASPSSKQQQKKSQKDMMLSLEQSWSKLINAKQAKEQQLKKDQDFLLSRLPDDGDDLDDQPFSYQDQNYRMNMGNPSKTIFYDQDEYYDDEEDDDLYDQKGTPTSSQLSKTKKSQELQFQKQ